MQSASAQTTVRVIETLGITGTAASAQVNTPDRIAMDSSGNIYIADANNHRIRKIDAATGNISTVAGTGTSGYSGDGAAATAAQLASPAASPWTPPATSTSPIRATTASAR